MSYNKIIEKIEIEKQFRFHFTDYDFNEILKINCPRPENTIALREKYLTILENLKQFLKTNPNKESISEFILNSLTQLDSSKYIKEEFTLLILKYNGFNYFMLQNDTAMEFFKLNGDALIYETL
jgi:hypothetical protein